MLSIVISIFHMIKRLPRFAKISAYDYLLLSTQCAGRTLVTEQTSSRKLCLITNINRLMYKQMEATGGRSYLEYLLQCFCFDEHSPCELHLLVPTRTPVTMPLRFSLQFFMLGTYRKTFEIATLT